MKLSLEKIGAFCAVVALLSQGAQAEDVVGFTASSPMDIPSGTISASATGGPGANSATGIYQEATGLQGGVDSSVYISAYAENGFAIGIRVGSPGTIGNIEATISVSSNGFDGTSQGIWFSTAAGQQHHRGRH